MKNEKGYILVLALMMSLVLSLVGMAAFTRSIYEARLAGNQYRDRQAFHVADAGWRIFAGSFETAIVDNYKDNVNWRLFLSHSQRLAEQMGYDSANSNHVFVSSQSAAPPLFVSSQWAAPFVCIGKHELNKYGKVKDLGYGMREYIVESHGYDAMEGQAHKITQASLRSRPNSFFDAPAALYSKGNVNVQGASTRIQGSDQCGSNDKPGIITMGEVSIPKAYENKVIFGNPPIGSPLDLPIEEMVAFFSSYSDPPAYKYSSDVTLTGQSWGSLDSLKVVYFDMANKTVTLTGGTQGAGLLLVKGNLKIHGPFSWYGYIIVTGFVSYTGGGEQFVRGAVFSGNKDSENNNSPTIIGDTIGGNAVIEYCGKIANDLKKKIPPMRILAWREVF